MRVVQLSAATYSPERKKRGRENNVMDPVDGARKKLKFHDEIKNSTTRCNLKPEDPSKLFRKPQVAPSTTDDEIKRRIGFSSENTCYHMLL